MQDWLDTVVNARLHGTTQRIVSEAFAAEQPELQSHPGVPFDALLKLERRVSHEGLVSIGGNYYSVPDRTRRLVEVHQLADCIRILDEGRLVASHPVLRGAASIGSILLIARGQLATRRGRPPRISSSVASATMSPGARSTLSGRRRATGRSGEPAMTMHASTIDSIRKSLVGLRMPRALEALDATLRRIEQGEIDGIQAFDVLLMEELTLRESRRIKAALMMARLTTVKTVAGFNFAFQPPLDRNRSMALPN